VDRLIVRNLLRDVRDLRDVGENSTHRSLSRLHAQAYEMKLLTLTLALVLCTASMPTHAIEEPSYEIVRKIGDVEVRQYAPYTVAEVVVDGSATEAANRAFRILAGYIFGRNKGDRTLAMTAPVTQTSAAGGYLVQFVLPRGMTPASAPEPQDARITLRQVPSSRVAVIRYSGFWSEANYSEHLAQLEQTLRAAGVTWSGQPVYSRYNAPFVPWFLRRNEIWLQI